MRYAINLNLDYASHPQAEVKNLFREIREDFIQAGFRQDGRLFTIALPEAEACRLARDIVENAARRNGLGDAYCYVKEFYGFNFDRANNLLLPSVSDIGVVDMEELPDMEFIDLKPPAETT
ncbi:MAG: hypothetical protein AB7U81_03085 [Thiohalomonadaceae bacterium]